jgi:hypothetical protein
MGNDSRNYWLYDLGTDELRAGEDGAMVKFLLWCLLLVFCWPLALLALVLYPIVWLLLIPFRLVGITVEGVLELVKGIIFLPGRLLKAI